MNITERFLAFTLLGAEWVLWLLIILSVVSVAIMIERAWYFFSHSADYDGLSDALRNSVGAGKIAEAQKRFTGGDSIEEAVLSAGVREAEKGVDAVAEAMMSAKTRERPQLERGLAVLGTLGNNAPFIGLFGTVLGIIKAFHDLAGNQAGGVAVVMAGISEALVATAVGLLVAIPAVVGFNFFNRIVRTRVAKADSLSHLLLAQLQSKAK